MFGFSKYVDYHCSFLKKVQKKSAEFKELVHNHCKPLSAILTILEPNLLCVFPFLLQGELRMHTNKTATYGIPDDPINSYCAIKYFEGMF